MIDWNEVLGAGLWLLGLGLLLAIFSVSAYNRRQRSLKATCQTAIRSGWAKLGAVLFCSGMALSSASVLEQIGWALLILATIYSWLQSQRQRILAPKSLSLEPPPADSPITKRRPGSTLWRIASWLTQTELLWLALLAPFFIFPAPTRLLPLLGLPLLWLARRIAYGHFIPRTPLDWPILLLLVMVLVSLYATPDLAFSLGKISGLLFGIGLFYALAQWAVDQRRLAWLLLGFLLAGVALLIVGLVGTDWVNKWAALSQFIARLPVAIRGLTGAENGIHSNELAGALIWLIPLQLAIGGWLLLRRRNNGWGKRLAGLAVLLVALLSGGLLTLAQSRSALAGLLLGLALFIWLAAPRLRLALSLLVAASLALILYLGPTTILGRLTDAGLRLGSSADIYQLDGRLEIWSRGIYGVEDFPFTGMGMNMFRKLMPILYPTSANVADIDGSADIAHAHNELLQVALDLGLPGLIAYLAILIANAALITDVLRRSRDTFFRTVAAGLAAAMLAQQVFGLTDAITLGAKPGVFFWTLLAITTVIWRQAMAPIQEQPRSLTSPVAVLQSEVDTAG